MKNTIIMQLAEIFCPHYCISCGKAGGILCGCCKKYIMAAAETKCLCCERELIEHRCPAGCLTGVKQFCLGRRKGVLSELIRCYKYHSVRSAAFAFAEMLDWLTDEEYRIVPLPTIAKHIRGRGFDHMALIAKKMNGRYAPVLCRRKDTVQVGADREQRIAQAKEAYFARGVDVEAKYLLIDDVWTTGSSMKAALAEMQKAGVRNTSVMIIAKSD